LLIPEGFICVDIPQTIGGLTAATKHFIGLYMNRKLAHGNNPILNWHASCLALVTDGGDNCKPSKPPRDTASKRIDGVAATITALARAVFADEIRSPIQGCGALANPSRITINGTVIKPPPFGHRRGGCQYFTFRSCRRVGRPRSSWIRS